MKYEIIKLINNQFIKFCIVGVINTLFSYTMFALFITLRINYSISLLLATVCGILFNYRSTGKYVFNHRGNSLLFKFFILYLALYIINLINLKILNYFIQNFYISGVISVIFSAIISFFCNRKFIFNQLIK